MRLADRKRVELANKLASLEVELRHWLAEAAARGTLEKHHTQVNAVAAELEIPLRALRARLEGAAPLAEALAIERLIIDLHVIWDVFRSKLALRYVVHFRDYLVAADELAYRCYEPAERRGAPREPPLVYFGDDLSPLTRRRGDERPGVAADYHGDPIAAPLRRLPVPLIGVPWFQVAHLPDAPIIAHEVGHDVEADLSLAPAVGALLERALDDPAVPDDHRRAWCAWRAEAFADVFATLALGPAFTGTLIDFLATEPRRVATEWQADGAWQSHPPRTLRVLLSAAALELLAGGHFTDDAARLRARWSSEYETHAMGAFEREVPIVARAIVDGPYPALCGKPLTDLIAYSPESHQRAERDARDVPLRFPPTGGDARELVAAARLAFDRDPRLYEDAGVSQRMLREIADKQTVGTRAGTTSPVPADVRAARAAADGEWLLDHLARARGLATEQGESRVQAHHR